MRTADELWELLDQARRMPYGSAQIALIEQILRQVDEAGDADLAFTARLIATTAYTYGGEKAKSFVTFSWCLADFDRNPGPHHQRRMHTLLWHFKYMVNALGQFPEIPLDRTFAVLDDMERRYLEAGHSLQTVHKHRYLVANHLGRTEEADECYTRWQAAPRDSLSDCAGCDPTDVANYLNSRRRYADVIELAEPVLAGDLTCNEQPQGILRELTEAYLHTGDLAKAADAHRRAYRLERGNLADLWNIGSHLAFCGRTGNEHRGLEMLQRHVDWLEKAPSPAAEMNFAADAAMLLRRLTELGHGDLTVRRGTSGDPAHRGASADPAGRETPGATAARDESGEITVAALATEMAERAMAVAARFDARNGNDYQGRQIADRIAAEPYGIEVPLSPTARPARPPRPAGPVGAEVAAPAPAPAIPPTAGAAELIELAGEQSRQEQDEALAATLDAVAERFPMLDDPLLAAKFTALTGNRLRGEDDDAAVAKWAEAAEMYAAAGAEGDAIAMRARVATARAQAGDIDDTAILADVEYQEENGGPVERAAAWPRLSIVHMVRQEVAEAIEAGERGDAYAAESGDPRLVAMHAGLRARIRAKAHDHQAAREAAREAWDYYRVHGPSRRLADVATLYGQLAEDPETQLEAFGTALATGEPGEALPAHIGRGNALKRLGRAGDAIADLVEAVALCAERGFEPGGAYARYELAEAYALAGRAFEAAEVAEEALAALEAIGDEDQADNMRFLLARQYLEIGDKAGAVARYRELIERLAGNPAGRGQVGEEAAGLLYDLDRDAEAADAFLAAANDLHEAGDLIGELRALRRRVAALHFADDPDAALEAARLAAERFAALPEEQAVVPNAIWQNGLTAWEHGRVLMSRGRYAEALPVLRDVAPRLRAIGAEDDGDRLAGMYGEALFRSGETIEAEAVMSELLGGMAPDAPGREVAEKVYAEIREALGTS